MCYTHFTAAASFDRAVSTCRAQGGELWLPRSAGEAGMVESAFGLLASNGGIWIGLKRRSMHVWMSVDGSYWVPEYPTTGASYGVWSHWGRDQYTAKLDVNTDMGCAAAQTYTLQYALYTCDPYSATSRTSSACYQTAAATYGNNRHMSWRALGCGAAVPFVCATPAAAFQCPPPPQPAAPPAPPVCESWSPIEYHMPYVHAPMTARQCPPVYNT
jgi:hypothetical protein